MTQGDVAVELRYFICMIGVVFAVGIALGMIQPKGRSLAVALVQATAFTAVGMLATIRPGENDGQIGLGIPLMWIPFFIVSLLGLWISKFALRR